MCVKEIVDGRRRTTDERGQTSRCPNSSHWAFCSGELTTILKIGSFMFEITSMLRFCLTLATFSLNDIALQNFGVRGPACNTESFKRIKLKIHWLVFEILTMLRWFFFSLNDLDLQKFGVIGRACPHESFKRIILKIQWLVFKILTTLRF